jgi:hypothetical protein
VLDIYDLSSKGEPDDVRWEKVQQFKLILTSGAYPVAAGQVAARLIEEMLESGRIHVRRRHSKLSRKTIDSSGIGEAGVGGKVKQAKRRQTAESETNKH